MSQYGLRQSLVRGQIIQENEWDRMEEWYSNKLQDLQRDQGTFGMIGAGLGVGLGLLLTGGTAAPWLLAGLGSAGYYGGSELGESYYDFESKDVDKGSKYGGILYQEEKDDAKQAVIDTTEAEQLSDTINVGKAVYSIASIIDGGGNLMDLFSNPSSSTQFSFPTDWGIDSSPSASYASFDASKLPKLDLFSGGK